MNFREDWTFIRIGITTHNILDGINNKSTFEKKWSLNDRKYTLTFNYKRFRMKASSPGSVIPYSSTMWVLAFSFGKSEPGCQMKHWSDAA